jgi:hypothetical protein
MTKITITNNLKMDNKTKTIKNYQNLKNFRIFHWIKRKKYNLRCASTINLKIMF